MKEFLRLRQSVTGNVEIEQYLLNSPLYMYHRILDMYHRIWISCPYKNKILDFR